MHTDLKSSMRSFQVCGLVSQIKQVKTDFGNLSLFQNSFNFVAFVV